MAVSIDPSGREVLLSPAQVAQICGLSRRAVYDAIARGELEAFRICARLRISSAALADWLRRSAVSPQPTHAVADGRRFRTVERRGSFKAKLAASAEGPE
jgi:excisionase family DNA binding protein